MDSFSTPTRSSDFDLVPRAFHRIGRKRYISDSSEEEGEAEGSPLAQPLMATPESDPQNQLHRGQPDELDCLSLSVPMEEAAHGSQESDKVNGKEVKQVVTAINSELLHRTVHLGNLNAIVAGFAALGFPNRSGALEGTLIPIHL